LRLLRHRHALGDAEQASGNQRGQADEGERAQAHM
jgi:hypothetical protein